MPSTTNPADWFLRDVPSTDGNSTKPLIDGADYFKELKSAVESLGSSAYLLISGWRLNPESSIDPPSGQSMGDLITTAIRNGVNTKSMLWYVPGSIGNFAAGHGVENVAFTDLVTGLGGEAILDNRLPNGRFASHHQKFIVTGSDTGDVAFVGGIDIAPDRWDESDHDTSALREPELFNAWHDVQVRVEGPAVTDIWNVFQERWNDPRQPHNFPASGGRVPPPLPDSERPAGTVRNGTHSVQVVKTYACKSNAGDGTQSPYPFAPNGANTYQRALIRAINNAEQYIYVEDQYFWPSDVVDALAVAVSRGITAVLMLARTYDVDAFVPYHNFLQGSALTQLTDAQGANQLVFVYHLEQPTADPNTGEREQIYVHAKTVIIDDRYLVIGSANMNRRSFTTDSELGVAIVDTNAVASAFKGQAATVSSLAHSYRKALWTEHLGTQAPDDPFDANGLPAGFPTTDVPVGHVSRHEAGRPQFCQIDIIPFGLMNAKTTCNG